MKRSFFVLLAALALIPCAGSAQFSLDKVKPRPSKEIANRTDTVKYTAIETEYFNHARWRAERRAVRRERNKVEFGISLHASTTQYNDAWSNNSSGNNTISGTGSLYCYHEFTKNRFTQLSRFDAKYGINSIDKVWFKNQDEFVLSSQSSWKMIRSWSYGANARFRSQFAKGYKSRTDRTLVSDFMAPGYLDLSVSINYKHPNEKFPLRITLSPVAGSGTFVMNEELAREGKYGVRGEERDEQGVILTRFRRTRFEGGSSAQFDFDRAFGRKEVVRYRTTLYSFYGWFTDIVSHEEGQRHLVPTVRWENTIDIKATKLLSTSFYWQLFYDRSQVDKIQMKYLLSVGLTYIFKNK